MRLHTSLSEADINEAATIARVDIVGLSEHGSRKREHAFEVSLEGESRRRTMSNEGFAATWDQWGVFLSVLFDRDPDMTCWAYTDAKDFDAKTRYRFGPKDVRGPISYTSWWPSDAHGDHVFRWNGTAIQCTKCTAIQGR